MHFTESDALLIVAMIAVAYGLYLLERIRAELRAIAYNTGRASENVAHLLKMKLGN